MRCNSTEYIFQLFIRRLGSLMGFGLAIGSRTVEGHSMQGTMKRRETSLMTGLPVDSI